MSLAPSLATALLAAALGRSTVLGGTPPAPAPPPEVEYHADTRVLLWPDFDCEDAFEMAGGDDAAARIAAADASAACTCETRIQGLRVRIADSYRLYEDRLHCNNCTTLGLTALWDEVTAILSVSGTAELEVYADALATIAFESRTTDGEPRRVQYNFGHGVYAGEAQRFYAFVQCPRGENATTECTWEMAQGACADARNDLLGLAGYLATPATEEQSAAITSITQRGGWIGAADVGVEGDWRWVTGPAGCPPANSSVSGPYRTGCELAAPGTDLQPVFDACTGGQCSDGKLIGRGVGATFTPTDGVAYVNFAAGQPDERTSDCGAGSCAASGEDYLYMLPGADGEWADLSHTPAQTDVAGYICAWGGAGFGRLCLSEPYGEALAVPAEGASGAPVWLISALVTLILVALIVIALLLMHYRFKLATAKRRRYAPHDEEATEYGIFAGLMTEHYLENATQTAALELAVPLKQREKQLLADVFLHLHTKTPATDLPLDPESFPRGPGEDFFQLSSRELVASLELFHARVTQMWYAGPGTLYDELVRNLKFPETDRGNCHVVLREVALGAWRQPGVTAVPCLNDIGPLQLLCMLLFSQEGPDIDRLLLFRDAPVWAPGNLISKRAYEAYEYSNTALYRDLDATGKDMVANRLFGTRLEAAVLHSKWIKTAALLSAIAPQHPARDTPVYRACNKLDKRIEMGTYLVFPTPVVCTTDLESARAFAAHKRRYQPYDATIYHPPVIFRVFNVHRSLDLTGTSQYPVEHPVLLPLFTPFRVESIRMEQDTMVVDLRMEDVNKFLDAAAVERFRRDVVEDAWEGEERISRIGAVLERHALRPPRANPDLMTTTAIRVDATGCVRGNTNAFDKEDLTRCHECGVFAHGMAHAQIHKLEEADERDMELRRQEKLRRERNPKRLWVVGAPTELCGMYEYVREGRTWRRGGHLIRHVGNRWALSPSDATNTALIMSANECPFKTPPHTIVRWARPINGEWTEDPAVRITVARPPDALPPLHPTEPAVDLPDHYGGGGSAFTVHPTPAGKDTVSFQSFASPLKRSLLG